MIFRLFLLAFFLLPFAGASHAEAPKDNPPTPSEDYADMTGPNLMRTLVRFNAINITEPVISDEFAIVTECDLYKLFYHDDFKWNKVRQAVIESVRMNIATYPVSYNYSIKLQLGRYDFAAKIFRFTALTKLNNVNTFRILTTSSRTCGAGDVKSLPHGFRVVLSAPIFLEGLPLSEKDAQTMIRRMDDDGNPDRILYTRFNMRIVYIEPLHKKVEGAGLVPVTKYAQSDAKDELSIRLDARLDSIDFYTDAEMAHLAYEYQP